LKNIGWTIRFRWIKAHAGNWGNELAVRLAKEASDETKTPISFNRIPKSVIKKILEDNSVESWQKEWDTSQKGRTTKEYFPEVAERLRTKIHITPQITTMVTSHGNIKSSLCRFKIIQTPNCPCGNNNQTTDHLLLDCALLQEDRTINSSSS
jgi:hypothetical protein